EISCFLKIYGILSEQLDFLALSAQDSLSLPEGDHHTQGIDRRSDESVSLVEALGALRNSVDKQGPDACDLRHLDGANDGVPQKSRPYSLSLERFVHSEAAQDHHRNGVRHVALDAAWRPGVRRGANGEAVITSYFLASADDIGAGRARSLVLQGAPP